MANLNIEQVYVENPSTNAPVDSLMYLGIPPYGLVDDSAIKQQDLFGQLLANGAVVAASTVGIAGTYANGTAGVGATFTPTATGALILDTVGPFQVGDQVFLKNQGSGSGDPIQNGAYLVVNPGSVGVQPILIRSPFFNNVNNINVGALFHVISGTQAGTFWQESNSTPISVGIDPITFAKFSYTQLSSVNGFTAQQYFVQVNLTDAATITWNFDTQQVASVLLTAAVGATRVLQNPTNLRAGSTILLKVIQSSAGGNALTYGTAYKFPGGVAPTLSTAANAIDILTGYTDGTNVYMNIQKGWA